MKTAIKVSLAVDSAEVYDTLNMRNYPLTLFLDEWEKITSRKVVRRKGQRFLLT